MVAELLTDKQVLDSLMLFRDFKLLTLKEQDGFQVACDMLCRFKLISSFEVFNSKLKHIKNVAIKNAPKHDIIGSLLLMTS